MDVSKNESLYVADNTHPPRVWNVAAFLVQLTSKHDRSDCWHCCCIRFIYTKNWWV